MTGDVHMEPPRPIEGPQGPNLADVLPYRLNDSLSLPHVDHCLLRTKLIRVMVIAWVNWASNWCNQLGNSVHEGVNKQINIMHTRKAVWSLLIRGIASYLRQKHISSILHSVVVKLPIWFSVLLLISLAFFQFKGNIKREARSHPAFIAGTGVFTECYLQIEEKEEGCLLKGW